MLITVALSSLVSHCESLVGARNKIITTCLELLGGPSTQTEAEKGLAVSTTIKKTVNLKGILISY